MDIEAARDVQSVRLYGLFSQIVVEELRRIAAAARDSGEGRVYVTSEDFANIARDFARDRRETN